MRYGVPYMAKAIFEHKETAANGDIVEIHIFEVPKSETQIAAATGPNRQKAIWEQPEGVSYTMAYIRNGERIVGYDNFEGHLFEGSSHHKHIEGRILPYEFVDEWKAIEDFYIEIEKAKQRGLI